MNKTASEKTFEATKARDGAVGSVPITICVLTTFFKIFKSVSGSYLQNTG